MVTLQQFGIVVDQPVDEATQRALFARCRDVTIERKPNHSGALIMFDRPAPTLIDAILTAVRDLDAVGLCAARVRDDDDLVTLAVIAKRVGRSREAVRLWSIGRTGPGGFPAPIDIDASVAYYRWSQVAPWLRERMKMPVPDPEPVLAAVNLALQLRAMAPRVSRMDVVRALIAA
jgi:hypothetical protein